MSDLCHFESNQYGSPLRIQRRSISCMYCVVLHPDELSTIGDHCYTSDYRLSNDMSDAAGDA